MQHGYLGESEYPLQSFSSVSEIQQPDQPSMTSLIHSEKPKKGFRLRTTTIHDYGDEEVPRPLWSPILLRRWAMMIFWGIFLVILIPLVALYVASMRNHGVSNVDNSYYYVWTYGPPAVFMVISAFWSRVQYRAMQLMPWAVMLRQPQSSENGVLLNYVSDWILTSLWTSARRKHFLVTIIIVGNLLLTGGIVFSTGLLAMQPIPVTKTAPMNVSQVFGANDFDPEGVDSRAYGEYLAVQGHNGTSPLGLARNNAFPAFNMRTYDGEAHPYRADEEYRAVVDVFNMEVECEAAPTYAKTITYAQFGGPTTETMIAIKYPDCEFAPWQDMSSLPQEWDVSTMIVGCNGEVAGTMGLDYRTVDWRFVVLIMKPEETDSTSDDTESDSDRVKKHARAVVCTPRYSISPRPIRLWTNPGNNAILSELEGNQTTTGRTIEGITASNILQGIYRSVSDGGIGDIDITKYLVSAGPDEYSQYWDVNLLRQRVQSTMAPIGASIAALYLLEPADETITGTVKGTEQRLVVAKVSFILVTTILCLLIALASLLVVRYLPLAVCPRDPGTIAGFAAILTQSRSFLLDLMGLGSMPMEDIQATLAGREYRTIVGPDGRFSIVPDADAPALPIKKEAVDEQRIVWWRPFAVRLPWRFVTVAIPLALIAALEALYQYSRQADGIAQVQASLPTAIQYTWRYIPAIVALLVRVLYHLLESAATVFHRFHQLQKGRAAPKDSVLNDYNGKLSLYIFLDAVRNGYWALASASLAVLLSFALPITVSGLYNREPAWLVESANVTQLQQVGLDLNMTEWDMLTQYNGWSDQEPARLASMVVYGQLAYPQWTYAEFALPELKLDDVVLDFNGSVDVRMPATRGNFNCTALPSDQYTWTAGPINGTISDAGEQGWVLNITLSTMGPCIFNTSRNPLFTNLWARDGYFGGEDVILMSDTPAEDAFSVCPSRLFSYGRFNATENRVDGFSMAQCWPYIEEVAVDARFSLPSFIPDASKPPVVVPGSGRDIFSRSFDIGQGYFDVFPTDNYMGTFLTYPGLNRTGNSTNTLRAATFAAIHGVDGVPEEDLLDPNTFATGLNRVYGRAMAQFLNAKARRPLENDPLSPSLATPENNQGDSVRLPATIKEERTVLAQSLISTRIIEAILGAMVLCALVSYGFMSTRSVLPKNPGSIAAMASLLAGSELVTEAVIPAGSEWRDDRELRELFIFRDRMFTLAWWPGWREPGGQYSGLRYGIDYEV